MLVTSTKGSGKSSGDLPGHEETEDWSTLVTWLLLRTMHSHLRLLGQQRGELPSLLRSDRDFLLVVAYRLRASAVQ